MLGIAILNTTVFCSGTTVLIHGNPSLCFFIETFEKAFAREGIVVADVSQSPSQLAASHVLEARPL